MQYLLVALHCISFSKMLSKPQRTNIIKLLILSLSFTNIFYSLLLLFLQLFNTVATTHSTTGSHITRQAIIIPPIPPPAIIFFLTYFAQYFAHNLAKFLIIIFFG